MSHRSRAYIEACYLLDRGIELNGEGDGENGGEIGTEKRRRKNDDISLPQIEQVMKPFKCH